MKKSLKIFSATVAMLLLATSCGVVSFTGRKQMLLFSDAEITALSEESYTEFMSTATISSDKEATAMLKGVGNKMVAAIEAYMKEHDQSNVLSGLIGNSSWYSRKKSMHSASRTERSYFTKES